MRDGESTRWQHNRIYPQPLHTHNSLRVDDRYCFHPGIFQSDIVLINNNQSVNPDHNCLTMRVIQCVRNYDACDLNTIIYHDHCTRKDFWDEDRCDYAAI